jgi:hypothetical protein
MHFLIFHQLTLALAEHRSLLSWDFRIAISEKGLGFYAPLALSPTTWTDNVGV